MAAPTVDGVASAGLAADVNTSVTVTAPGGTGGNLFAWAGCDASYTVSAPSGWATSLSVLGTILHLYLFSRADDAAGSYVFTVPSSFSQLSVTMARIGGATLTGLVTGSTINTGNVTHFTSGSITTTAADSLALWFGWAYINGGTWTTSGSQTEKVDFNGGTVGGALSLYSETVASISTPTAPVLTRSGYSNMGGISLAISPSAGAAGQPTAKRFGGVQFAAPRVIGASGVNMWRKAKELILPQPRRVIVPGFEFARGAA